jgi:hypothetical protein
MKREKAEMLAEMFWPKQKKGLTELSGIYFFKMDIPAVIHSTSSFVLPLPSAVPFIQLTGLENQ